MTQKLAELINYIDLNNAGDFSECQRLFHGRGHAYAGFEHLCIDWLPPVALITLYQEEKYQEDNVEFIEQLAQWLQQNIDSCKSVQTQHRWQKYAPIELMLGDDISHTNVTENGIEFGIELGKSQNTGLFLDMRNGRNWVKQNACDKKVLNLFSYTCGFSVAAIAGGAAQVVNVDMSKASLSKGRENHRLNQQDTSKVVFQGVDIFKSFGRLKKFGPYQLLIADPPSFQKGSVNIQKDYGKIIRRIPDLLTAGGQAMLCLNSPDLDENFLFDQVKQHCPKLKLNCRIDNPSVYKEAHQGKGLKVFVFDYLPAS